ncbi:MAG: sensor histidine kinase [Proteobacteria bacterium]|nr:sensor histidine kinase [Pseudomonadota bacterium]
MKIPARSALSWCAALCVIAAVGFCGFAVYDRSGRADAKAAGDERIGLYASTLNQVVERFRTLPFVLANDERIHRLLEAPTDPARIDTVNRSLASLAAAAGADALYVMNAAGLTLAASNYDQPKSFIGENYSFRPYFRDAVTRGFGQFFAIGVTTGEPGYFLSRPVWRNGELLGVAVVKISLEGLEADWRSAGETIALADNRGVLFLASPPNWKYRPIRPLSEAERTDIKRSMQYSGISLEGWPLLKHARSPDNGDVVDIAMADSDLHSFLVTRSDLQGYGWTLYAFTELAPIRHAAILAGAASALTAAVLLLLSLWWRGRRATLRAKLDAHDMLEQRVTERTHELVRANESLSREIEDRRRAEDALKRAQDELVQASKLAALGQMSAALAHEINQPLAALKTTLASAKLLIRNGSTERAAATVATIDDLVARMSELTQHLRTFARKDFGETEPVDITVVAQRALALANARLGAEGVRTVIDMPAGGATVIGNATRLEQVLLNLLGNAADAVANERERTIAVSVVQDDGQVQISVADSGPGIAPQNLASVFDPFFTTKQVGKGLGLGLSISYAIIEDHGGRLRARNRADGGAEFSFNLPVAQPAAPAATAIGA